MFPQVPTFTPLPPREDLERTLAIHQRHLDDLTSYLWYIMPVAEECGEEVYDTAAQSLNSSGIHTTAEELKALAAELQTPEGKARYAENRRIHIGTNLTSYKGV
jgi:hypothetical protein